MRKINNKFSIYPANEKNIILKDRWDTIHYGQDKSRWEYDLCSTVTKGYISKLCKICEYNRNEMFVKDKNGESLLYLAIVFGGHLEMVQFLLKHLDVNIKTTFGVTPLHIAAQKGRCKIAQILIQHGANLNEQSEGGRTALQYAIYSNIFDDPYFRTPAERSEVFKLLVNAGADPNIADKRGWNSLHYATWKGSLGFVTELLAHGAIAGVNARETGFGRTPLHFAAARKNKDIIEILLKAGADVNLTDFKGKTILHYLSWKISRNIINELTQGADANARDSEDRYQQILYAVQPKCMTIFTMLIAAGARTNLKKFEDLPALSLNNDEMIDIMDLLEEKKDKVNVTDP